jgi:hypothetical protein
MTSSFPKRETMRRTPFLSTEQSLDLVAALVLGAVVMPRRDAIRMGRNDRRYAEVERQSPGFVALDAKQAGRPCLSWTVRPSLDLLGNVSGGGS